MNDPTPQTARVAAFVAFLALAGQNEGWVAGVLYVAAAGYFFFAAAQALLALFPDDTAKQDHPPTFRK